MKATVVLNQEELELKAIDSMIAYGSREGHRKIVLKGWIIKTIYALDSNQLKDLDRITFEYLNEH